MVVTMLGNSYRYINDPVTHRLGQGYNRCCMGQDAAGYGPPTQDQYEAAQQEESRFESIMDNVERLFDFGMEQAGEIADIRRTTSETALERDVYANVLEGIMAGLSPEQIMANLRSSPMGQATPWIVGGVVIVGGLVVFAMMQKKRR